MKKKLFTPNLKRMTKEEFQKKLKDEAREKVFDLYARLDKGKHYLMGIEPKDFNAGDALEAFGFTRDGLMDA